jgi:outer membrane protein assembly factor BamB
MMRGLLFSTVLTLLMTLAVTAQVNSVTKREPRRTGANLTEATLTTANVNVTEFGKLCSYPVDGPVSVQPLYVTGVTINGVPHNVLYVATMNDKLYAFDADGSSPTALWITQRTALVDAVTPAAQVTRKSNVFWDSPSDGPLAYAWSENDVLKAYRLNAGRMTTPAYMQGGVLSPDEPGASLTLSANGSTTGTGIVWASMPITQDGIQRAGAGILRAYDAETLTEIWTSEQNAMRDHAGRLPKFVSPVVANGRVYMPTLDGSVVVYGLLPVSAAPDVSVSATTGTKAISADGNTFTGVVGALAEPGVIGINFVGTSATPMGAAESAGIIAKPPVNAIQIVSSSLTPPVSLDPAVTVGGIGAGQGVEVRDGKVYLYGDATTGIIREYDVTGNDALGSTGRQVLLTVDGRDVVPHPTGFTTMSGVGTLLGNTVAEQGTIFMIDWARALASGTLDGAIQATVADDLAVNGTRPEFVRVGERWLVATADYGAVANEIRIYDPQRLKTATRTSEPGVLVYRFRSSPFVQTLHWLDSPGLLVLVQNQRTGQGWRLTVVDLARSIAAGQQVVTQTIDLSPQDELEGFHLVAPGRGLFLTSSSLHNLYFANVRLF